MSNTSKSIQVNLFRLDSSAIRRRIEGIEKAEEIPEKLIACYNSEKKQKAKESDKVLESYSPIEKANSSEFSVTNKLKFYKKNQTAFVTHTWVNFFEKQKIELGDVKVTVPHIVCFVIKDNDIYAITTGAAYVVFESFIDQAFPIEIAKRILKPEVKGGMQQAISGDIMVADIYFRRPVRIGLSDSHQEVWKNLSGNLLENIRDSENFKKIFGTTKSINIQVKASIKFSCRVDNPNNLLMLIEWLEEIEKTKLSEEQKQAFAFYDSIRPLSNRRDKELVEKLSNDISENLLKGVVDSKSMTLSHEKISQFMNAEKFSLCFNKDVLYEWKSKPSIQEVYEIIQKMKEKIPPELTPREILEKLKIFAFYENDVWENTEGTVLQHLSGEHIFNGNCFYLLNGEWFQVERSFQDVTDTELKEILTSPSDIKGLSSKDLELSSFTHANEGEYNEKQATDKMIWCDKVFYETLELADLLFLGNEEYLGIIQVKLGLGASTRDAVSQLRNAMSSIENDLRLHGNPVLSAYYDVLVKHNRIDPAALKKEQLIALFKRKRRYVFAYVEKSEITDASVLTIKSSIAKNELVSLVQFSKRLGASAELKIVWIQE